MLHPALGSSLDPVASWQVDTQEITVVVGLYDRQLSDVSDPQQMAKRLGLLWKKLAPATRLASLLVEYTRLQLENAASSTGAGRQGETGLAARLLAAFHPTSSRDDLRSRVVFIQEDPLYDRWLDA